MSRIRIRTRCSRTPAERQKFERALHPFAPRGTSIFAQMASAHSEKAIFAQMASSHSEKEKAVNVQVLLRCRPDELRNNARQVVTCNDFQKEVAVSQTIAGRQIDRVFTFDKVFGPSAKQKDLYEQAITPIVNEVLEGFSCTIFAYGQTGTGKTYTMEGEYRRAKSEPKGQLPLDAGVIPRAIKQIFDALECQHTEYSVKVTFLELYNEEITDLLAPEELSRIALEEKKKKKLPLMEDDKGGVLVQGLEEKIVTSADEIFSLLERGSSKRQTAETLLNKQSSRSHSIFSITIHIKEATLEGEELIKCGKLNLVDLAGSENISRSGARKCRAKEAGEINKSLLTLGRVITALVEHLGHIPYRDSKLTRLLRDSLGGRTKTCIIATVSPSVHCLEETLSTLDYAHRAKNIKNRPEVNQKMMKSTLIKDLYGEIDRLKAEVYATREKVGVYIPKERYYQEEAERKAMIEQIEQMRVLLESNQKESIDLRKKLEATERNLDHASKLLATAKEDLQQANYQLKEKDFVLELLVELREKSKKLQSHSSWVHEVQTQNITEFQNAYEEQTRSDTEKLVAQVATLVSTHMNRQKELVDAKLNVLRDTTLGNKTFLDKHTSSMATVTNDAKRKWEEFYLQMQHDSKDGSDSSSAKHCRLEAILQQCVNTMDTTSQQWGTVHASASEMSTKHVKEMDTLVRNAMDSNDQHDVEIDTLRLLVDEDTKRNSSDVINHFDAVLEYERESIFGVMEAVEAHASCLQELSEDHNGLASSINCSVITTLQHDYMDYEPSGETPLRSEPDVPSKGTIESLRTMPINALLEEFRENNPYESTKEPKPSLIPRFPLIRLN